MQCPINIPLIKQQASNELKKKCVKSGNTGNIREEFFHREGNN